MSHLLFNSSLEVFILTIVFIAKIPTLWVLFLAFTSFNRSQLFYILHLTISVYQAPWDRSLLVIDS